MLSDHHAQFLLMVSQASDMDNENYQTYQDFIEIENNRDLVKGAVIDMRYFARSKLLRSSVHKKYFSLIWLFKLGYVFCQER